MCAERAANVDITITGIDDNTGRLYHGQPGTQVNATTLPYDDSMSMQYPGGMNQNHQRTPNTVQYPPQTGVPTSIPSMTTSSDLPPALMPPLNDLNVPADSPTTIVNTSTDGISNNRSDIDLEPIDIKHPILHVDSPRSSLEREKVEIKRRALEPVMEGPKLNIRILLMSGQSHTFAFPPTTTIEQLKDLVFGEWPGDWKSDPGRPPASNYFRLLYMGRILADTEVLSGLNLKPAPNSTIVHLSVRTMAPAPEEPPKKSILPFSLPTLPRPSGLSSRQNSSNVPTTSAPGSGQGGSQHVPPGARAGAQGGSNNAAGSTAAGNNPAAQGAGQNGRRAPEADEHGGGCKCVIQ